MERAPLSPALEASAYAFHVEAPRVTDALSLALCDAFARELGLPDDMAVLLNRIDRCGRMAH